MPDTKPIDEIDGDPAYAIADCQDPDLQGDGLLCPNCDAPAEFAFPEETKTHNGQTCELVECTNEACYLTFWVMWPFDGDETDDDDDDEYEGEDA